MFESFDRLLLKHQIKSFFIGLRSSKDYYKRPGWVVGVYGRGHLGVGFYVGRCVLSEWIVRRRRLGGCFGEQGLPVGIQEQLQYNTYNNNKHNSIRVGYDRMEQIREGVSGDRLEGNFWEERLPPCIHSQLECLHGWTVHILLWQLIPVRYYSNAERMLAATGLTPLLQLIVCNY